MHASDAPQRDPRLAVTLLFAATGLVMALTNPPMVSFDGDPFAVGQQPAVDRIMEWRPHGPPPWVDADQFTPDEIDEAPAAVAAGGNERTTSGGDARARPEL